jgi:hypothetical protein
MSATQRIVILLLVGLAFVVGNSWQFAGAQAEKAKVTQQWEYKVERDLSALNERGAEGWELVAVGQPEARLHYLYFKRPKQ